MFWITSYFNFIPMCFRYNPLYPMQSYFPFNPILFHCYTNSYFISVYYVFKNNFLNDDSQFTIISPSCIEMVFNVILSHFILTYPILFCLFQLSNGLHKTLLSYNIQHISSSDGKVGQCRWQDRQSVRLTFSTGDCWPRFRECTCAAVSTQCQVPQYRSQDSLSV